MLCGFKMNGIQWRAKKPKTKIQFHLFFHIFFKGINNNSSEQFSSGWNSSVQFEMQTVQFSYFKFNK